MTSQQFDDEKIFHFARKLPDQATRSEYFDQVCAGDQALRERVESLLAIHEQEQVFLKSAASDVAPTVDLKPILEAPGQEIGRYKLLQKIGEGGFGVVYMAEQTRPVKRKVALKVIKPGMDSAAVIARFEAERQALAMMDHSNIAKVFDGGATEEGRPYFVMELVKGVPITTYCDDNRLRTAKRLELFIDVCKAVQHAHHKGIIHRDIKPSNVMVTLHDGQPVVKVIDFGVAKAMHTELTEKTLFTAFGQMIGTPQYMSPEQAELSGLDVDTRSDLYSLGVLLYELLTGTTPLEADVLKKAGFAGMQRMIKETEPPKPSARLSSSGDQLTHIAEHRSVSPDRLNKEIRGDLDWIVMKALEKNRNRRYDTANGLARDVERSLAGDAVEACPPSLTYRTRRFFSQNKLAVGVTALVFVLLSVALGVIDYARRVANDNEQAAIAARADADNQRDQVKANLTSLQHALTDIAFDEACNGDLETANKAIEELRLTHPDARLVEVIEGIALYTNGKMDECVEKLSNVLASDPDNRLAKSVIHWAAFYRGSWGSFSQYSDHVRFEETASDYERLFVAMSETYGANDAASESIAAFNELIARHRRWGIAYAFRAAAFRYRFMFNRDLGDMRKSIVDIEIALTLLPKSDHVKSEALTTYVTAFEYANAFPNKVEAADLQAWKTQANLFAKHFEDRNDDALESVAYVLAFYRIADPEAAVQLERKLDRECTHDSLKEERLFAGRELDALLANKASEYDFESFSALAQFEVGQREEAIDAIKRKAAQAVNHRDSYGLCAILRFLGDDKAGIELAMQRTSAGIGYGWTFVATQYIADEILPDEYLRKVYPFNVPVSQAHYFIGLNLLSQGKKEQATQHFEAVVQAGHYGWPMFHQARAFLKRLEDPEDDFPNWIVVNEQPR